MCVYVAHIKIGMHRGSAQCTDPTHIFEIEKVVAIHRWTQRLRCICPGVAALFRRSLEFCIFVHLPSSTSSATGFNLFAHSQEIQSRRTSRNRKRLRKLSSNNSTCPTTFDSIRSKIRWLTKIESKQPEEGMQFSWSNRDDNSQPNALDNCAVNRECFRFVESGKREESKYAERKYERRSWMADRMHTHKNESKWRNRTKSEM